MSMIFNRVDGKSHSQILTYDAVVRKLTYEDKEKKGDICSNEGDWVLDLFSGLGKFYYMELNFNMLFFN